MHIVRSRYVGICQDGSFKTEVTKHLLTLLVYLFCYYVTLVCILAQYQSSVCSLCCNWNVIINCPPAEYNKTFNQSLSCLLHGSQTANMAYQIDQGIAGRSLHLWILMQEKLQTDQCCGGRERRHVVWETRKQINGRMLLFPVWLCVNCSLSLYGVGLLDRAGREHWIWGHYSNSQAVTQAVNFIVILINLTFILPWHLSLVYFYLM